MQRISIQQSGLEPDDDVDSGKSNNGKTKTCRAQAITGRVVCKESSFSDATEPWAPDDVEYQNMAGIMMGKVPSTIGRANPISNVNGS